MKYFRLITIVLLSLFSNLLHAQQTTDLSPLATEKAKQQKYFFAGIEATKSAIDYKSTDIEYLKKTRYPRALACYVRAAEYFARSEKIGTYGKSATDAKITAIAEADKLFEICDAKSYDYPISLKERIEQLKQEKKDKLPEEVEEKVVVEENELEETTQESKTPYAGRKIYLDGKVTLFSMVIPAGLKALISEKMYQKPAKKAQSIDQGLLAGSGFIAGAKFFVNDPYFEVSLEVVTAKSLYGEKNEEQFIIVRPKDQYSIDIALMDKQYGAYKGTMSIDNTKSGESFDRFMMNMKHKVILDDGITAYLSIKVNKNLYSRDTYDQVMSLFKSFKVEDGKDDNKLCKTLDEKLLHDQAIKVTYYLLDPYRKPFMLQKPVLERDKVPAAWAEVSSAIIKAIKNKKTAFKGISTIENLQNNQQVSAAIKQIGWVESIPGLNIAGVEFFPAEVSGAPTGNVSNLVTFYLNALRVSAEGIKGLEDRLNNMAIDLYWEIPYIVVEGYCIPKMKCKNGEWVPDYSAFVFEEKKRTQGKFTGDKKFMTMTQVHKETETNFNQSLSLLISNETYLNRKDKCRDCGVSFNDIKFPGEIDKCDYYSFSVQSLSEQINAAYFSIKLHKKLLTDWESKKWKIRDQLDKLVKILEKLVAKNSDAIIDHQKQIVIQKKLLENYTNSLENATENSAYQKLEKKITFLENEVIRLKKLNDQLSKDIIFNDHKISKITANERDNLLQNEISKSEAKLKELIAERLKSMKLREKSCK